MVYVTHFIMNYGAFLAQLRQERGLTQTDLADASGISRETIAAAESTELKRMYPRTFLSLFTTLHRRKPLSNQEIAHFSEWSGITVEVLHTVMESVTPPARRTVDYPDLPPLNPSLTNAMAACLLKMSQSQLADVLYEVAQTLTRAQLEKPLPPGTAKPTTITGPGLLGLQHPDDNGYRVTVFFEPREELKPAASSPQPRTTRTSRRSG